MTGGGGLVTGGGFEALTGGLVVCFAAEVPPPPPPQAASNDEPRKAKARNLLTQKNIHRFCGSREEESSHRGAILQAAPGSHFA